MQKLKNVTIGVLLFLAWLALCCVPSAEAQIFATGSINSNTLDYSVPVAGSLPSAGAAAQVTVSIPTSAGLQEPIVGYITSNTYGFSGNLFQNSYATVISGFSVSTQSTLTGCSVSPQVGLFDGAVQISLITMTNNQSSWSSNYNLPYTAGANDVIGFELATAGVGCTNEIPITVKVTFITQANPAMSCSTYPTIRVVDTRGSTPMDLADVTLNGTLPQTVLPNFVPLSQNDVISAEMTSVGVGCVNELPIAVTLSYTLTAGLCYALPSACDTITGVLAGPNGLSSGNYTVTFAPSQLFNLAGQLPASPSSGTGTGGGSGPSSAFYPYDIVFGGYQGLPAADTLYPVEAFDRTVYVPANFGPIFDGSVSYGTLGVNPTSTAVFTLYQQVGGTSPPGTQIGTITISTAGAFTFASTGGAAIQFNKGDTLNALTPVSQDATLSSVSFTIASTRYQSPGGTGNGGVSNVGAVAPVYSTGGVDPVISLQNSAGANVTAALGTDTEYMTASGIAAVQYHLMVGDANGGMTDSGDLQPQGIANVSHKWLNSYTIGTGAFTQTQPAISDLTATFSPPLSLSTNTLSITCAAGQIMGGATPACSATPALGTDNSVAGTLQLANGSSAHHTILATGATANYTFTLPTTAGTNTYVLQTDGSGNTSWVAQTGSGTVGSGTATHLAYYASSGTAVADMGVDFTFLTHTLTGGASAILDLHSAASFEPPGGGGTLILGTSNQNWATLGTGIVKNTTTTGALSNATSGDILGLCTTCVTSASSLGSTYLMTGAGSQGSQTPSSAATLNSSGQMAVAQLISSGILDGESPVTVTTSTPTTVASAAPDPGPKSAIAVATASSKKLLAPMSAPGAATEC